MTKFCELSGKTFGWLTAIERTDCGVCNKAKSDTPYEDFISWIKKIAERFQENDQT